MNSENNNHFYSMKHFPFLAAFGVAVLLLASFVAPSPKPAEPRLLPDLAVSAPRYPLTVVKVKGRVSYGASKLMQGNRITDLSRVKFDSTNNVVKIKDANSKGYFMIPRDYALTNKKACTSVICSPKIVEKAVLPGGF